MGYTHYMKLDEPLTEAQASAFRDACMDFVSLVPNAFLCEALEHPDDLDRRSMEEPVLQEHAAANQCLLEKDAEGMASTMAYQGRGFLCLPRGTESLAVNPGKDWMCCKTGSRGTPSDSLVVCLIMAGQEALREGDSYPLRFHSDGDLDDMEQGLELWEDCTGAPPPRLPFIAGRRKRQECRPYMDRRTEAAQLIWTALLKRSGKGGGFEAAARERGEAGLRNAAREPVVIDACLEGFRDARLAGAVCDFARDYVPAFAEACLDGRSAGLRRDWRERLKSRLALRRRRCERRRHGRAHSPRNLPACRRHGTGRHGWAGGLLRRSSRHGRPGGRSGPSGADPAPRRVCSIGSAGRRGYQ